MVEIKKLTSYSFILIGLVFLIQAIGTMYALTIVGGFLGAMSVIPGAGSAVSTFNTYINAGWIFAVLQLITGLITLIAGAAYLVQK